MLMSFFNKANKKKSKTRGTHKVSFKKLVKKVNKIERMDRPELKHVFLDQTLTPPMSVEVFPTTSVQHCVVVPQGVNGNQRLGNKIMGHHIDFNYELVNFLPSQIAHTAARVMLVLDKRSNQIDIGLNAAQLADLMQVSAVNGQYLDPLNTFNQEYKDRFKILYDKTHSIGGNQTLASLGTQGPGNKDSYVVRKNRISCKHKMVFDTNQPSGASGVITEGTIWLIYKPQQTENLGVLQQAPLMHWFLDYFYTDA